MKVLKVIVDEVPECCGDCDEVKSREEGGNFVHECHFETGFIKNLGVRLWDCPLVTAEHLFLSPFRDWDWEERESEDA